MDRHSTKFKELIEQYLKKRDKVEPIVNEIRNKNKSIEDIPKGHEKSIIETKIQILNNKDEYFINKPKFEAAVKDYVEKKISGKNTSIQKIAKIHGISFSTLKREINRHSLGENYQYHKKIKVSGGANFSYQEEQSLLESLKLQFTNTDEQLLPCSCRACFLLKLSTFAYEFAVSNKTALSSSWSALKRADMTWLSEFEMRNSCEISTFCSENCTLNKNLVQNTAKELLSQCYCDDLCTECCLKNANE